MGKKVTANEYQQKCLRTNSVNTKEDMIINGVMGLCGESGEVIDIIKKWYYQGHNLEEKKVIDEVGDVLWYVCSILSGLNVTLEETMEHNIEKLKQRYPNGFDSDKSVHRLN